jgi:VanZ family protein
MTVTPNPRRTSWLRCFCLLLAAAVTFQLFYLGSQPLAAGLIPPPWDKLAHLVVYSAITVLLWIGTGGRAPILVVMAAIAIGALDELHQAAVPGRNADAGDFLMDVCAGIGTGIAMQVYVRTKSGPAYAGQSETRPTS